MKYILLTTLLIATSACAMLGKDKPVAEEEGRAFAKQTLLWKKARVTCQDYDSDGDGYVSCTAVNLESKEVIPIECSGWMAWNSGCRVATGKGTWSGRE